MEETTLRPVEEDDLPLMERFLTDPEESSPFQWHGWWDTGRRRRQWAENALITDDVGHLIVQHDGEAVGFVSWRKVTTTRTAYHWNMGIALLREARGQGVGTRAQRLLVEYLFAHTQVVRIEADTEVDNIGEQRALEKAGFTQEGVMRSVGFRNGRWRDCVRYSVLREDVAPAGL